MGILGSSNIFSLLYFSFIFLSFPLGYCCCSCEMEATVAASVASVAMVVVDKRADRAEMIIDSIYEFCLRVLRLFGSACAISIHTHTLSLSLCTVHSRTVYKAQTYVWRICYIHMSLLHHIYVPLPRKKKFVCAAVPMLLCVWSRPNLSIVAQERILQFMLQKWPWRGCIHFAA